MIKDCQTCGGHIALNSADGDFVHVKATKGTKRKDDMYEGLYEVDRAKEASHKAAPHPSWNDRRK